MKEVLCILCLILMGLAVAYTIYVYKKRNNKKQVIVGAVLAIIFGITLLVFPIGLYQVETGEAVVLKSFGEAKESIHAGLHWRFWPRDNVEYYDLKTQEIKEKFEAYSQDAQPMDAQLTIQFKIQPDKLLEINKVYGSLEVLKERIISIALEKAKVVLSRSSAMVIIETRSSLSNNVEEEMRKAVQNYYIDLTMVVVEDLSFNEAFENAVEQKMIAEQQKLQAEYDKATAIIKAEQELEVAKKKAEAEIEKAKGDAQAQIEVANAQAEEIKIKSIEIARMLGFTIDEDGNIDMTGKTSAEIKVISDYLKYIEYLRVWDGKLPTVVGGDSTTIYIPDPSK